MKRYIAIDMTIMKSCRLSLMDWCILENINFLSSDNGWCYATKKSLASHHAITERGYQKRRADLVANGWLKTNSKGHLKTTKKWYEQSSDHEQSSHEQSSDDTMNKVPPLPIKEDNLSVESNVTPQKNVSNYLLKKILSVKPNFKKIGNWEIDIELAIRIDKRSSEELIGCIDWIYSDKGSFWIKNIMSGRKLREQFDRMEMQMMDVKASTNMDWVDALDMGVQNVG